jgi:hypothetical protein
MFFQVDEIVHVDLSQYIPVLGSHPVAQAFQLGVHEGPRHRGGGAPNEWPTEILNEGHGLGFGIVAGRCSRLGGQI